jgi:uncharacterized transporter YbjL
MEYSLTYLFDIISAFVFGLWLMDKIIFYRIRKTLEEAGVEFDEEEDKVEVIKVKKCFVEKINESLYLYEHTTNNFIAQAKSLDELAILAKDQARVVGVSYNEEVLWFVDGKVRTTI